MTSGRCHFSSLHSHFADCLVPELPLPINLHHSPSLTPASWHLSPPLRALPISSLPRSLLFVSLSFPPPHRRLLSPSTLLLCVSFSHSVSSCHPLLSTPPSPPPLASPFQLHLEFLGIIELELIFECFQFVITTNIFTFTSMLVKSFVWDI